MPTRTTCIALGIERNRTAQLTRTRTREIRMSTVLEGGCLCGKIRFRATQTPLRTLACHCTFCQRMTGSSFYAESLFPMEAVQFTAGEARKYEHTSDGSGKKVYVEFCADCGSTVGLTFERWPELRAISRGCYDNPNDVDITANIWTRSAQTSVALPSGIDCFTGARMTLDGTPEQPVIHESPVMAHGPRDA
jgi:hypothetical protein